MNSKYKNIILENNIIFDGMAEEHIESCSTNSLLVAILPHDEHNVDFIFCYDAQRPYSGAFTMRCTIKNGIYYFQKGST